MSKNSSSSHLLGKVALSFSGGGGRAAAYHLGTLSCLDRLDLLADVSIISSASGGTFTAAKYALSLKQAPEGEDLHETFRKFYKSFTDFLVNADLIPRALKALVDKSPKSPSPRRTVVKALADVYDQTLMDGARFESLWKGRDIHLKDIIFNSTECKHGMAFRFQKTEQNHKIGNSRVWIDKKHAMSIRMADIVAASSDIPVGLEPLIFPRDFVWPEESPGLYQDVRKYLQRHFKVDRLPLMDGGVIDNQGIEGVLIAARPPLDPTALTESAVLKYDLLMEYMNSVDPMPKDESIGWVYDFLPDQDDLGLFIISDVPELSEDIYDPKPDVSLATLTGTDRAGLYVGLHLPHHLGSWLTVGRMSVVAWILFVVSGLTAVQLLTYSIFVGPPYRWDELGVGGILLSCGSTDSFRNPAGRTCAASFHSPEPCTKSISRGAESVAVPQTTHPRRHHLHDLRSPLIDLGVDWHDLSQPHPETHVLFPVRLRRAGGCGQTHGNSSRLRNREEGPCRFSAPHQTRS